MTVGRTIRVLDDKGFVELVDYMGGDAAVARAARVSYKSKGSEEADKKLIHSLMKNGHESPFEHAVMTFHVKAPIFVARHYVRHRISSWNELSGRYTELDECYVPKSDERMYEITHMLFSIYHDLVRKGVEKQTARMILPLSTYTEWYWTLNARSLMNVLDLRANPAAQVETQAYAVSLANLWKEIMPVSYDAYLKYRAPHNSLLAEA
jgi:thymidylate synthase (FAD)